VLDVFAYTGGFSVYAARGAARDVTSVEISRPALAAAQRNMALNRAHPAIASAAHHLIAGDAFEVLQELRGRGRLFDLVILDPPSFAKTRGDAPSALAAYRRVTRLGLGVLRRGGTLVVACCSSHVSALAFLGAVRRSAAELGRPLRTLAHTGHPLDHPIGFREGAYLNCLFVTDRPARGRPGRTSGPRA
jgi:23S rRNA (cytosine1962-C5)-methyltransferase